MVSMQNDALTIPEADPKSPGSTVSGNHVGLVSNGIATTNVKPASKPSGVTNGNFPPPKTDKPRPHTCNTCGRSFARLEHLKRHERSHTKEKPFECPECNRCFARRDLLLRHQQKLHLTNNTTRPRNGRRESVVSVASNGRIRKGSIANMGGVMPGPRPRANTISHVDPGPMGMFNNMQQGMDRMNALGLNMPPQMGMPHPSHMNFDHRGLPNGIDYNEMHGLTKINTHFTDPDSSNTLRTAPPYSHYGGFEVDQLFTPNTTVNPASLHFGEASPMPQSLPFGFEHTVQEDDYGWVREWNMQTTRGPETIEQVLDESSPSRGSSGNSPADFSESMNNSHVLPPQPQMQWQQHPDAHMAMNMPNVGTPFHLEMIGSGIQNLDMTAQTMSPSTMHAPMHNGDGYFHSAMMQQNGNHQAHMPVQHETLHTPAMAGFGNPLSHTLSNTSSHASFGVKPTLVTSLAGDSITDSTRQAIEATLSPVNAPMGRKYSHVNAGSPLTPGGGRAVPNTSSDLPPTEDLVKYVEAFIQFALPHLPVVHMPTLTFESIGLDFAERAPSPAGSGLSGIPAGAQCLLLNMAAIGALYEYDYPASKKLYNAAKKMISIYLEERRKIEVSSGHQGSSNNSETPMWLVEAMLLTVIYGHHCGDKLASDIANNHIAALVSLTRAAKLSQPPPAKQRNTKRAKGESEKSESDLHAQWLEWKDEEERKRIFFAIFILSSLLTTAYSLTPAIMNSEIQLSLPCDEGLWTAETAQEWQNRGGLAAAEASSIPFATALSKLLTANQRSGGRFPHSAAFSSTPLSAMQSAPKQESELKPSTFGCYVLINALHNYIWETRSRHQGREWTLQESEAMVEHIEPALSAWHDAWGANERHRLERPNPFGLGPLSADSRPLLDLAFVRLYVNFGRTLECFYHRDFDGMAEQLRFEGQPSGANGASNEGRSPLATLHRTTSHNSAHNGVPVDQPATARRERYLRRAALYAADSFAIACRMNLTYADAPAHELPIQSAICFSDSARVLAEWVNTVQDRVGKYLGVIGRDPIDFSVVPAVVLLAAEDMELLGRIEEICTLLEAKRLQQENLMAMGAGGHEHQAQHQATPMVDTVTGEPVDLARLSLGSRVVRVVAAMLEKAVIWPITGHMARALEVTATHIERRANESLAA